ncbi:hypothetical protein M406DRAFT_105114 [Cryphonectria parasitica EP155]|uniref:Uncharacterized protein n=1 Tax=Cryphonectria parasitica (strain ATCC 38755 / EP155) TaxID=660469 RepID=A0A9P5CTX2_CRYP1|nr:uncharacterized protein M406DRAFT_105114 [Cryphonectria parasitica EP155]KAF3769881.1 hypothetical protein M406DRAFT_105114 [Cryphonectria parasitica EP155]
MDAGNFTEDEKRFVLAEYIKASQVDTEQLVAFIKMNQLQTDWFSMQLPGDLPSVPNLKKRKSASDLLTEQAPKRMASMAHIPYHQQQQQQQQQQQHQQHRPPSRPQDQQTPPLPQPSPSPLAQQQQPGSGGLPPPRVNLNIQPRPALESKQPTTEGYNVFQSKTPSNGYGVFQSNPTGRKRGRPSKAEKEAQARANSSSWTTTGPIPISPKPAGHPPTTPLAGPPPPAPPPPAAAAAAAATGGGGGGTQYPVPSQAYNTAATSATSATSAAAGSMDSPRDVRGGNAGSGQALPRPLQPQSYAEHQAPPPAASMMKSEKSPSIGNLVTADSPPEQPRSVPTPIVVPHTRDPPPVTNSA